MRALVAIVVLAVVWGIGVDEAKSVAGWGTALLLLALATACGYMWRTRSPGPPWLLCATAFTAMAIDDYFLGAHDEVRREVRSALEQALGPHGALLVAATALVAGAVAFAFWFVARLPRRTAVYTLAGFAVAIFGAGVIDVLGGRISVWVGRDSEWHRLNVVLEESLELVGVALIFFAMLELVLLTRARCGGARGNA